jgi:preprotein translocase subunit SecE
LLRKENRMNTSAMPKVTAPTKFVKEVIGELKKVEWPTRAETIKLTVIVILISVAVGAFIGVLDATFLRTTSFLFRR